MSLIQRLNEAANIPVEDLKAKMQKDPRVKQLFARTFDVDAIKDRDEFIRTLRFYLFSNHFVRDYVKRRTLARELSTQSFKLLDKALVPGKPFTQTQIDWLREFIKILFKDVGYTASRELSKRGRENVATWVNDIRGPLDTATTRELNSLAIRPTKPITLYRAFVFHKRNMEEREIDHTSAGVSGYQFFKSVRAGTQVVKLSLDIASLWTKDRNEALSLALYGRNSSWRKYTEGAPKAISDQKGEVSFVVSARVDPVNIIADLGLLGQYNGWPTPHDAASQAVIVAPGEYTCRINSKHSRSGEEDPVFSADDARVDVEALTQQLTLLARIIKLPKNDFKFEGFSRYAWSPEVMSEIVPLNDPDVQHRLLSMFKQVFSFYKKHLEPIDPLQLANQLSGRSSGTIVALNEINDLFDGYISHSRYEHNIGGHRKSITIKIKELRDPADIATAQPSNLMDLPEMIDMLKNRKRETNWRAVNGWKGLAEIGDPKLPWNDQLARSTAAEQMRFVDAAMKGFYSLIGQSMPDTHEEQARQFSRAIIKADIYGRIARFLQKFRLAAAKADT